MLAKQPSCLPSTSTLPSPSAAPTWLRLDLCERYGVFPLELDRGRRAIRSHRTPPTQSTFAAGIRHQSQGDDIAATASSIERAIRKYYWRSYRA